jgi:hypothetical protein
MSDDKPTPWIELLKFPVLVLSIVLGLLAVKSWSILDLSRLTKISTTGIEFEAATAKSLTQIEERVASLEAGPKAATRTESMDAETIAASQTTSDSTARVSALATERSGAPIQGFVWIGDYDAKWHAARLGLLATGQPADLPPEKMQVGTQYRALDNLILRDQLPAADDSRSRGRHGVGAVGVVPGGKTLTLLAAPVPVVRSDGPHDWARVRYGD